MDQEHVISTAESYDLGQVQRRSPHAIIIGGGIAGCALALFLTRWGGYQVSIFESHTREKVLSGGIGGGLGVAPNGMQVLQQLGLADRLRELGLQNDGFEFVDVQGQPLVRMTIDPMKYSQPALLLRRATLHQVLMEAVEKEDLIRIEFDKCFTSVSGLEDGSDSDLARGDELTVSEDSVAEMIGSDEDGPVCVRFQDGSQVRGDLIIGADGVHSRMRSVVLGEADPKPQFLGLIGLGGFVESDLFLERQEEDQGLLNFIVLSGAGNFGFSRVTKDDPRQVMWWRNMQLYNHPQLLSDSSVVDRAPTRDELLAIDEDHLKECIMEGLPPLARKLVEDTKTLYRGMIHDVCALPRWYRGRACLIGDAAHAVSPHSGQGASLALEDAMFLGHVLRLANLDKGVKAGKDSVIADSKLQSMFKTRELEKAFQTFQFGRKDRVERIVAEGRSRGEQKKNGSSFSMLSGLSEWIKVKTMILLFRFFAPYFFDQIYGYRMDEELLTTSVDELYEILQAKQVRLSPSMERCLNLVGLSVVLLGPLLAVAAHTTAPSPSL